MVGKFSNGQMAECFNKGAVTGWGEFMGGLAGFGSISSVDRNARISDSYNTGEVSMTTDNRTHSARFAHTSGLVGQIQTNSFSSGAFYLSGCYNSGTLSSMADAGFGQTNPFYYMSSYYPASSVDLTYCYAADAQPAPTASNLGTKWQDDVNGINGGWPLLAWEDPSVSSTLVTATFFLTPADAVVKIYSDAALTREVTPVDGGAYQLLQGKYYYKASANGYVTERGNFNIVFTDVKRNLTLREAAQASFRLSPVGTDFRLYDKNEVEVAPVSSSVDLRAYTLYAGDIYTYTATASGYNGTRREIVAKSGETAVTLSPSTRAKVTQTKKGGQTITKGGEYKIERNASAPEGTIGIYTTAPVTLVGDGTMDPYVGLSIVSNVNGADVTLRDVFLSVDAAKQTTTPDINLLDFPSGDNTLRLEGVNVLDLMVEPYSQKALVHVPPSSSLTVSGEGTLYFYKSQAGAAFGGNGAEMNGRLVFDGPTIFGKGTKQGAVIGSGANAKNSGSPGDIVFRSGVFTIMSNSRGALIGGGAGSDDGAAGGGNVYIEGGAFNLNIDYSGAAIGGGGYEQGNDADGGNVYIMGGSIRTYMDLNAVNAEGIGALWPGATEPGVNDVAITATKLDGGGSPVSMLTIDTNDFPSSARGAYAVELDGQAVYGGGLHRYSYINENTPKSKQREPSITMDNWASGDDSHLYLYATEEDHTLTVNGAPATVAWDEAAGKFTYKLGAPSAPTWTPAPVPQDSLTEAARGGIVAKAVAPALPGAAVTLSVGKAYAGQYVFLRMDASPVDLGWHLVNDEGEVTVTLPAAAVAGSHKITVQDRDGEALGWTPVTVAAPQTQNSAKQEEPGIVVTPLANAQVKAPAAQYAYTGKEIRPVPAVTVGGKTLTVGADYDLNYVGNKDIGKATVTVTGKGAYSGAKSVTFKIVPKRLSLGKLTPGKKSLTVRWTASTKAQKVTGYELGYRVKGASVWKTKSVQAKSANVKLTKLTKGKKYEVRVRAVKKIKSGGSAGAYYGPWSATKTTGKVK
jgi:hypothetical protein